MLHEVFSRREICHLLPNQGTSVSLTSYAAHTPGPIVPRGRPVGRSDSARAAVMR
jgi:hypothetical protein